MNKKRLIFTAFFVIPFMINVPRCFAQARTEGKLSKVKVAVLYENITDGVGLGRSVKDTIRLLKETSADMIFRGFWKWNTVVQSPDNIPDEVFDFARQEGINDKRMIERIKRSGYDYQSLNNWISAIKAEIPDIIFCGAVPAQHLCRVEFNPITGKVYNVDETWAMALDPQKWHLTHKGKPVTKEQFQARASGRLTKNSGAEFDYRRTPAYFPDITNPDFQELLLSWAEKQIDCGADAIWIDMLCSQAKLILRTTGDPSHPGIKESLAAAARIVDRLHRYGESKGRHIYVGSWGQSDEFGEDQGPAKLDFMTFTPTIAEVRNKQLDQNKWPKKISQAKDVYGDIPIFSFIDWTLNVSQTVTFSQELSPEEQAQVLRTFDASFSGLGVDFVYPLHGGYMGSLATRLSFGSSRTYDSLAPEFATYETIKELAQSK